MSVYRCGGACATRGHREQQPPGPKGVSAIQDASFSARHAVLERIDHLGVVWGAPAGRSVPALGGRKALPLAAAVVGAKRHIVERGGACTAGSERRGVGRPERGKGG